AGFEIRPTSAMTSDRRWIVCAGELRPEQGFRDAIWALDMLRFLHPELHLLVIGSGPERTRLEQFSRCLRSHEHVHFLGERPDMAGLLSQAQVVWAPALAGNDVQTALEAMAAGRPVVASNLPAFAEVIASGETGFLVPPGDKANLARETRELLDDPALADRVGAAARSHVQWHFAVRDLAQRLVQLYADVAA